MDDDCYCPDESPDCVYTVGIVATDITTAQEREARDIAGKSVTDTPFFCNENAEEYARSFSEKHPAVSVGVWREIVTADYDTNAGDVERSSLEAVYAGGVSQSFLEEVK